MSNMPADPRPAIQVRCDEHHWVSTHQPDFPVYWIRRCSLCGHYDPDDMAEQIRRHATTPEQASLKAERDAAVAALARVRALCDSNIGVATRDGALMVSTIRATMKELKP